MVVILFYSCFLPVFCIFVTKSTWDQSIYEVGQLYFELIMKTLKILTGYTPATQKEHNAIKNSKNVFVKLMVKIVY